MRRLAIAVLLLNVISAVLFIGLIKKPVYDDQYNILDVHNYAVHGLSRAALEAHINAPGPASYIWMAAAVRLLGGDELRDARIAAFASWVLLSLGILLGARHSISPRLWYAALLTVLVFPHAATAFATVLTEGPSLLFAMLGVLAWTEFAVRPQPTALQLVLGMVGGLLLGMAVTCRQYNLALLVAAAVFAVWVYRGRRSDAELRWLAGAIFSLLLAAVPVALLILAWRGFASPGVAAGTTYKNWRVGVGINIFRPIVAAFYSGVYFVPLGFPGIARLKSAARWGALAVAAIGGVSAAIFRGSLLQPGPLQTLIDTAARVPAMAFILFAIMSGAVILCFIAAARSLWEERKDIGANPLLIFALLTVLFFIGEQVGVGGNVPLYDRYILQFAPFLGIIAFSLYPRLTHARIAALTFLFVVSQVMLWRYAFRV
jgi:Dolichyl-phosphate-mannose-protein mannosyltransferase